ncbi:hypothetical protein DPMN_148272 [Dreissena polymorpha]|uniref:Uncharacterized protein n=1 Tax=Dreissena polymorpha TaxID=45954 RepID=A0A9D4J3Q3_DREPO|nr:hypothetical protein DPMN_148272 [Dreissena polymorpha]
MVVTGISIPLDAADVASSVLVPLKSLGFSPCSPVCAFLEAPSTALLSGTHQSAVDGREVQAISSKTSMETTQSHPVPHILPVQINPAVPINSPTQRDVLTRLPKSVLYDGRSNWFVFKGKFERYAKING